MRLPSLPVSPPTGAARGIRVSSLTALPLSRFAGAAKTASKAAPGKIELYSSKYYYTCALGGAVACGATHGFVTPLDLVKCRKQVRTLLSLARWSPLSVCLRCAAES